MKNKKELILFLSAVVISILLVILAVAPRVNRQTVLNGEKSVTTDAGERMQKPTFMYFVTSREEKEADGLIRELEEEFGDRVIFEIKNISEDKGLLAKYPVEGNTPALIMELPGGDVSEILLSAVDKDKLIEAILAAL